MQSDFAKEQASEGRTGAKHSRQKVKHGWRFRQGVSIVFFSFFLSFLNIGSHVVQAGLKLTMELLSMV